MKNKITNIKVCAFDAYGTCFDINSAAKVIKNKIGKSWLAFSNMEVTTGRVHMVKKLNEYPTLLFGKSLKTH